MVLTNDRGTYTLQCDHCKQQHQVKATAVTEKSFRKLATGWGWAFDTEHGDLCARCARALQSGTLDAQATGSLA